MVLCCCSSSRKGTLSQPILKRPQTTWEVSAANYFPLEFGRRVGLFFSQEDGRCRRKLLCLLVVVVVVGCHTSISSCAFTDLAVPQRPLHLPLTVLWYVGVQTAESLISHWAHDIGTRNLTQGLTFARQVISFFVL